MYSLMSSLLPCDRFDRIPPYVALVLGTLLGGSAFCLSGDAIASENFDLHGQVTYTEQESNAFASPYAGDNSLQPSKGAETFDMTLSMGWRLSSHTELWLAPEIDQGFGLDNSVGLAGFSSGEAYKIGHKRPVLRSTRALLRWTSDGFGETSEQSAGFTNFAQSVNDHRLVLTVGKFSVVDVFDNSQYAHDPRNDFLNWSVIDTGSFDYAADAYGYSVGAALERIDGAFTQRVGVFDMSDVPNSPSLEPGFHEFELVAESEWRFDNSELPGRVFVTGFMNRARMAKLIDLLNPISQHAADPATQRHLSNRFGSSVNVEKALTANVGVFAKMGQADGRYEAYEFTEIDASVAAGITGSHLWAPRPNDHWGLSVVHNQISAIRQEYLNQGGLGILIGDGRLPHPGAEKITEAFYNAAINSHWFITLDLQEVLNPAYNRDRGPVTLWAVRLHGQF